MLVPEGRQEGRSGTPGAVGRRLPKVPEAGPMSGSQVENKIFVGGLAPHTTNESLLAHFSQYGRTTDCVVMMDRSTGRSRGFGFCTFEDPQVAAGVLALQQVVDGKEVECKACLARDSAPPPIVPRNFKDEGPPGGAFNYPSSAPQYEQPGLQVATEGRIFVGGLPQTCSDAVLLAFCEQFGEVTDCTVMVDGATGRSRGFGYVSFASQESVELILATKESNIIEGKWVEVKRCAPRPGQPQAAFSMPGPAPTPSSSVGSKRQREIAELTQLLQDPALGLDRFIGPMLEQLRAAAAAAKSAQAAAVAVLSAALPGKGYKGGKGANGSRYSPY